MSYSGYISKEKLTEFPDREDVECERKEEPKMTSSY